MEFRNYRVKSPVKSFRDLEVYQKTIQLSDEIKVLNLRKAWDRVFTNYPQNEPGKTDWRK